MKLCGDLEKTGRFLFGDFEIFRRNSEKHSKKNWKKNFRRILKKKKKKKFRDEFSGKLARIHVETENILWVNFREFLNRLVKV